MRNIQQRTVLALLVGTSVSVALLFLFSVTQMGIFYWPQRVGIYVCLLAKDIRIATTLDFAISAVPINSVIYAIVFSVLDKIFTRKNVIP